MSVRFIVARKFEFDRRFCRHRSTWSVVVRIISRERRLIRSHKGNYDTGKGNNVCHVALPTMSFQLLESEGRGGDYSSSRSNSRGTSITHSLLLFTYLLIPPLAARAFRLHCKHDDRGTFPIFCRCRASLSLPLWYVTMIFDKFTLERNLHLR